jgi:UDP-2,4-diacetamido-2,4,6-trideoxy-beta-L-altropyranose hydrolase
VNKRIYLRADGGPHIGWGHVNRLCALSFILKDEASLIAVSGASGAAVFRKNLGNEVLIETLSDEIIGNCKEEWKSVHPDGALLVLDGYHFDYQYQQEAKKMGFRVVLIDDFARGPFMADMLINHAPNSRHLYQQTGINYCCGINYALLRPRFYAKPAPLERKRRQVLFTLGGADPMDLTAQILKRLLPLHPSLHWMVVYTDNFSQQHRRQLNQLSADNAHITLRHNISESAMRQLMTECSQALVSASTVVLEAWSCGLFPAVICYTENQRIMYDGMVSEHYAFPIELENLESDFHNYLESNQYPKKERDGWNPPLAIRSAFQQIMYA